jgi:hypothetical protein
LNRKAPKNHKKKSDYNLYNQNVSTQPKMRKSKNHSSQANIHHKRTKTGFSSTGTGFLPKNTGKSQKKRKKTGKLAHTTSVGDQNFINPRGYMTQRTTKYDRFGTHGEYPKRKKSNNQMANKNLKIDINNNFKNYPNK